MRRIHSKAAILSVGDELTLGQTLDTNSQWISRQLLDLGILPCEHVTIPDVLESQVSAFKRLAQTYDLVICSGGLGPTADDLTRAALAQALSVGLEEDPIALAQIEAFYVARGREMPAINRVQALRPSSAVTMSNLNGTAPGIAATFANGCDVFCVPGPPVELHSMFQHQVLPRLRPPAGHTVVTRCVNCIGIGESNLATMLGEMMSRDRNPLVGTTASGGVVSCRIRYEGAQSQDVAERLVADAEAEVRLRAGVHAFSAGTESLESAVLQKLGKLRAKCATVESCTGGLVSKLLTDVPGSSSTFIGGLITYSNELKTTFADVDSALFAKEAPGAVSHEVAAAMAAGGLKKLGADLCVSVTGIAGPGGAVPSIGDRPGKPVGLVFIGIALSDSLATALGVPALQTRAFKHINDRVQVREWSAKSALAAMWFTLNGRADVRLLREIDWPPVAVVKSS